MKNLDTRMKGFVEKLNEDLKDHSTYNLQMGAGVDPATYKTFLDHKCTLHLSNGETRTSEPIAFTYHFTPTHIGTVIKVSCTCGLEKDVTDYFSW